jgi:hypothetical protein
MQVSILEFIAAGIAAYEHNGNEIKGFGQGPVSSEKVFSNTMLLLNALNIQGRYTQGMETITKLEITSDHLARAKQCKEILQDAHMLKILSNRSVSNWDKQIYDMLNTEFLEAESVRNRANMMVFVPKMAMVLVERQAKLDKITQLTSQHQGQVGDKLTLDVTVLQHFYMQKFDSHLTKAVDPAGNLYIWFGNKAFAENQKLKITAKVKKHDTEHETGIPSTNLHFVKVKEYAE